MKNTLKFLSIGLALVVLVISQQVSMSQPAEAALTEDSVKFQSTGAGSGQDANATAAGTTVKHYAANDTASFYIKDSDLNVVHSGTTVYLPEDADNGGDVGDDADTAALDLKYVFPLTQDLVDCGTNLDTGTADDNAATAMACLVTNTKYVGANTPIVAGSFALRNGTKATDGTFNAGHTNATSVTLQPVVNSTTSISDSKLDLLDEVNGKFSFAADGRVVGGGTNEAMIASYNFNAGDGILLAERRAKVTSSSDSTGEYISIVEVTGEGSVTAASNASFFRGQVAFSTDASHAATGTNDGSNPTVWVQTGDTITIQYLGACTKTDGTCTADGTEISTATATIDSGDPTITNNTPADDTLTSDTSPVLSFTINDDGAGFNSSIANFHDHIDLMINGCNVVENTEISVTSHSSSSITMSFDLSGTGVFSTDAEKAANTAADFTAATHHVSKVCNNGAQGNADAALARDITSSGFYVDSTTLMIEDGLDNAGHTDGGAGGVNDRDRTIHGKEFNWSITATDEVGNTKTVSGTDLEVIIDSVAPAMIAGASRVVGAKAWNATKKADEDDNSSIKLTFTETLDTSTVAASDFVVSGTGVVDATITAVNFGGTQGATDTFVYLDLAADLAPNAKPKVELVGQVSDLAGNVFKVPSSDTDGLLTLGTAADGVKPTISGGAHTDNYLDLTEKTTFTWASDENMVDVAGAAGACSCVYISGGNADTDLDGTDNKKKAATLTSPTTGKVELKQGVTADGVNFTNGIFSVNPAAEDAGNNHGIGGTIKYTQDVSKYFATIVNANGTREVKLDHWPVADHDGDGDLRDSLTAWTENGTAGTLANIKFSNLNWTTAETADITFSNNEAVAAGSTVKITYYYTDPAYVVEVDSTAPGVGITPANDTTSTNKRQRVTFAFTEDEYAGDTHQTVTVTKAELKDPDDVTTDILSSLITSDNKSFYYKPTSDLANGGYTVTVSATDDAGNALTDSTSKFTIKDRDQTTVAMDAGWNLISLPGAPADSAINTVITNTEVNTVLTYDPAIPGGWLTAIRDGDSLVGTLATVDATRGYWVQQDDGDDIKVDIPGAAAGAALAPAAIPVVKGWNLVPVLPLNNGTTNLEADIYFANIDWNIAKTWNSNKELWMDIRKGEDITDADEDGTLEVGGGGHDLNDLKIGRGIWVFANKAGTVVP